MVLYGRINLVREEGVYVDGVDVVFVVQCFCESWQEDQRLVYGVLYGLGVFVYYVSSEDIELEY